MATLSKLELEKYYLTETQKYLDLSELFPKAKIMPGVKPLTTYQKTKIISSLNTLIEKAGGLNHLERDFVPLRKSKGRDTFIVNSGLPKGTRGALLPGGKKVNKNVRLKNGILSYKRGEAGHLHKFIPLRADSWTNLEKSARSAVKRYKGHYDFLSIGTFGGEIRYSQEKTSEPDMTDHLIQRMENLYNKYASLADAHAKRDNGRWAAHPSKWGLGLLAT